VALQYRSSADQQRQALGVVVFSTSQSNKASERAPFQWFLLTLVTAAAYFLLGRLGLSLALVHPSATTVWPPSGMALGVLMIWGLRLWPGIFLGAFVVNLTTQGSWAACLGIASGNTLEAVLATTLIRKLAGGRPVFNRPSSVAKFMSIAALSAACGATVGATSLSLDGASPWSAFSRVWFSWWVGDIVSLLVFAPFLIVWGQAARRRLHSAQLLNALVILGAVLASAALGFVSAAVLPHSEYLTLLPLLWAAFKYGPPGATSSLLLTALLAIVGTTHGIGPFAETDPKGGLLSLMVFIGTISLSSLLLAAAVEDRRAANLQLAEHMKELERIVEARTHRLLETVQDLEAFSYSIAHDLRAPLRSIQGFSQIVHEQYGSVLDSEGKTYLDRIINAAQRLDDLIQDVLDYSRVVRSDLQLQPVEPLAVIRDVIESYPHLQAHRKAIEVHGDFPPILANPAALTQILSNLLGNAVKFTRPGVPPLVRVRAERLPEQTVRLWVEDNGIGLAHASHQVIFDLFTRAHPHGAYEGNGIGLSIVRKTVERMGGSVGVESQPGHGSRFWVILKAASGTSVASG